MPDNVDDPAPLVSPVSVNLPDFWAEDPRTWFCQAEAQFRISCVLSESLKFDDVIQKLPSDVIKHVRNLVNNLPVTGLSYKRYRHKWYRHKWYRYKWYRLQMVSATKGIGTYGIATNGIAYQNSYKLQ